MVPPELRREHSRAFKRWQRASRDRQIGTLQDAQRAALEGLKASTSRIRAYFEAKVPA